MNELKDQKDLSLWIEIDVSALEHNLKQAKNFLNSNTNILAVVKADGYGAGAVELAKVFSKLGVNYLGVDTLDEGLELRRYGINTPILLFLPLTNEEISLAILNNLTITISNKNIINKIIEEGKRLRSKVKIHLKVETGLNNSGLKPEEAITLANEISKCPYLELEGIYTHLSSPKDSNRSNEQFIKFKKVLERLKDNNIDIPLKHICNSYAFLFYPEMHLNMVRLGTLLYGQFPLGIKNYKIDLKDCWKLKAKIINIWKVEKGTPIGYGGEYITKKSTYLGLLSIGYSHGLGLTPIARPKSIKDLSKFIAKAILSYLKFYSLEESVILEGRKIPIVGRIGMQYSIIEFGDIIPKIGDIVEINIHRSIVNSRIPHLYIYNGKPYKLRTIDGRYIDINIS
jgi:alanine racemase